MSNYFLLTRLLGVQAPEPALGALQVLPRRDLVESASGRVPLPQGEVGIAWEPDADSGKRLTFELMAPTTVKLGLPAGWQFLDEATSPRLVRGPCRVKVGVQAGNE